VCVCVCVCVTGHRKTKYLLRVVHALVTCKNWLLITVLFILLEALSSHF